ncbi:MAG TPA: hypothetical protein VKK61_08995, partial [Tepidisphaeraceae bacterium]|nr:hypothetical protein [Tepidisphaeraceae bacterium]
SGDLAKAKQYANQLLSAAEHFRGDWNYGNAIYTGNEVLGDAALSEGDVAAAKSYLLAAAKTPGSPVLDSFGPNMTLARDLLAKGERETVLKYFDLCSNFWEDGRDKLKSWKQLVKDGGTPDFGANLDY